jgi:hypothetical protein
MPRGITRPQVIILSMALIMVIAGAWLFRGHQEGQLHLQNCGRIELGGKRSELIKILGSPKGRQVNPAGTRLVLVFQSPLFARHPIRAVVNVRDDVVMEIDCGDGRIRTYDKY